MQGDLTVESTLGKGSTFTVSLKRVTAATDAKSQAPVDAR
jgi:signal transduction histidine kinase